MAGFNPLGRNKTATAVVLDDFGGTPDGGLAIVTADGATLHRTSPRVAASLRYFLAKASRRGADGFPERLAITSALRGEGVTFTTRSLASVLAYDSSSTVAIVDLNWSSPPREGAKRETGRKRRRPGQNDDRPTDAAAAEKVSDAGSTAASAATDDELSQGSGQTDDLLAALPDESDDAGDGSAEIASAPAAANRGQPTRNTSRRSDRRVARSAASRAVASRTVAEDKPVATLWDSPNGRLAALIDAVEERASIDDILVATMNPRLTLVNGGELPIARRPAVAASHALEEVLNQVAKRFDHVLLDLPPVLASSDAIRLAHLADAFALVIRHGVTTTHQVESALDELSGAEPLGVIINRYATKIPPLLRRLVGL